MNNTNSNNLEDPNIKQLYNFYIKTNYIKIIRYKKMIVIICKFQKIYTNLLGLYNLLLLLKKTYIILLFNEFTYKS